MAIRSVVTDEVHRMVVFEELRVLLEDFTLVGGLDVGLELHHALLSSRLENRVQQDQRVDIGGFVISAAAEESCRNS